MNTIDQAFIRAYGPDGPPPRAAAAVSAGIPMPRQFQATAKPSVAPAGSPPAAGSPSAPPHRPPSAERRPLSTFTPPAPPVEGGFKPALEVESFRWSSVCQALVHQHRAAFQGAVETLLAADEMGRSLIGLAGHSRGVGCTTVVACLGRMLVEAGKTVAIVDGNFAAPGLARHLGLAVEVGWEEVLAGDLPLAETAVNSLADGLVIIPLAYGGVVAAKKLESIHASVTAGVLRYHYDLVLFDLGALADPIQRPIAQRLAHNCRLDGLLLTAPTGLPTAMGPQRLLADMPELASVGLGVIENNPIAA